MTEPLLATKLTAPPVRATLIPRERLIRRLLAMLGESQSRIVVLSAPAGYGKTTLLTQFAHDSGRVAWLTADTNDNDPDRFARYLEASVNDQTACILIIDDYQVITNPESHALIPVLLANIESLQIVLAAQARPPYRLFAEGGHFVQRLTAADLRLTAEEAGSFLRATLPFSPTEHLITRLHRRIEGWSAGLHLAALALAECVDATAAESTLESFTGAHRFIADYFTEEVFEKQPPALQRFLLETSVLRRLHLSLCTAIAGTDEKEAEWLLDTIEQRALFLEHEVDGLRYHSLFTDYLQDRFSRAFPYSVSDAHRGAAEWCEREGRYTEAINHWLASSSYARAAQLIEQRVEQGLGQGNPDTVNKWFEQLPTEITSRRPTLALLHAWSIVAGQRFEQFGLLEARLHEAQNGHTTYRTNGSNGARYVRTAPQEMLHGALAHVRGDLSNAALHYQRVAVKAESNGGDEALVLRALSALNLGNVYWANGDLNAASTALAEAITYSRAGAQFHLTSLALLQSARLNTARGFLHDAVQDYEQALGIATEQDGPIRALLLMGRAEVAREWGDLALAEAWLTQAQEQAETTLGEGEIQHATALVYMAQADLLRAQGRLGEAATALLNANACTQSSGNDLPLLLRAMQASIDLARGDLQAAARWMHAVEINIATAFAPRIRVSQLVYAQVLCKLGRTQEAIIMLARLTAESAAQGWLGFAVEAGALLAALYDAQGEGARALLTLAEALYWGEPGGYTQVYFEAFSAPDHLVALLKMLKARQIKQAREANERYTLSARYVGELIARAEQFSQSAPVVTHYPLKPKDSADDELVGGVYETLSGREAEILRLIAAGLSNQGIAAHLMIAESTVKRHLNNVYGKLQVTSRTQAIRKAELLGLL